MENGPAQILPKVIQIMARNQAQLDELDDKTQWISRIKIYCYAVRTPTQSKALNVIFSAHYDIGNEPYERFLDSSMQYSSAIYSEDALTLSKAITEQNENHLWAFRTVWIR